MRAHRVIWAMMTGRWPDDEIDHRDRDPANNRWENLREATHSLNMLNRDEPSTNTSGVKGVSRYRKGWRVQRKTGGRHIYDKTFKTFEEAIAVVDTLPDT